MKKYWFCEKCNGILLPVRGLSGGGKFIVNKRNPLLGIKSAIKNKKILAEDHFQALEITNSYFQLFKHNQVQLQGVACSNCGHRSVVPTLTFRYNDFVTKNQRLPYTEQVKLKNILVGDSGNIRYCHACGASVNSLDKFCMDCGARIG